jgi:hypothetical protein
MSEDLKKGQVKLLDKLYDIEKRIDTLTQLVYQFWSADTPDSGIYASSDTDSKWPYDEEGNLLPNVTVSDGEENENS